MPHDAAELHPPHLAAPRVKRHYPVGAEPHGDGVAFRVWAPDRQRVEIVLAGGRAHPLDREPDGYAAGFVSGIGAGTRYRVRLDGKGPFPDPASRFQPEGPHGPSEIVDPGAFGWSDQAWRGVALPGQVIYEMHVGTFTREGTWEAATRELPELAHVGITLVELMPVAEFSGRFGWGYDGVNWFAPTRLYGRPDDFRRFVDAAHGLGLGVILDVVYNHFGPDGNYLREFAKSWFSERHKNEWGDALNFDEAGSEAVRDFVVANVAYWIDEFHLDGLRLDATQQMFDASPDHIIAAVVHAARRAARARSVVIIGENEPQDARLLRAPEEGGCGLDALWNDDFHHSAMVALTGHNEAYFTDYLGAPQEFVSMAKHGFLYQGQRYKWQKKRRGSPTFGLAPARLVTFLQNHDQVANSATGERIHALTSPGRYRAMTALMLLLPGTPMLFQGQEFAASSPFFYFADQAGDLAAAVESGRAEFLAQFATLATPEMRASLSNPADRDTFLRSKLDFAERERHAAHYMLVKDLLRLRRDDPVFRAQRTGGLDGAVLGAEAFVLRFFGGTAGDRLVLVNLGRDLVLAPAPEPLLAPPEDRRWALLWSSNAVRYGGGGTAPPETDEGWRIPGHAALILAPGDNA